MNAAGPIVGTTTPPAKNAAEWGVASIARKLILMEGDIDDLEAAVGTGITLAGDLSGGPPVAGVLTATINALAVQQGMLATGAVTTTKIAFLAVNTGRLADLAVTEPKIADAAVTALKIAPEAVTNGHISTTAGIELGKLQSMSDSHIVGRTLGSGIGAPEQISPAGLVDIIEAELGGPIGGSIVLTGDVTGGPPVAGVITTAIGALKVLTGMIAANAVTTAKILDANVTNAKLADLTITNAKVSASAAIEISKLQVIASATVVGRQFGTLAGAPTQLNGTQLIEIIENSGGGTIWFGGTSAAFFAKITDETGSGSVVGSASPTLTGTVTVNATGAMAINTTGSISGLVVTGQVEDPAPMIVRLVPAASGTGGGQILSLFAPNLGDGNSLFFGLGKSWSSTNSGFVAFTRNATDANTNMSIGHWGKNDIFKVYKSGGCVVGSSSVDPGDNNLSVFGVYKRNNVQVVGARDTGWGAWTSFGNKTTKASNTATLVDCAQTIKSIIDALIAHGLIGT